MSLLARIDGALAGGIRFHEWKSGKLQAGAPAPANVTTHGRYLVARAPLVPAVWAALREALRANRPLVILPPSSPAEEAILLRQLPTAPPAGAVLALFTSGSTGEPKAVFHSESSLLASAAQLKRALPGTAPSASLLPAWGMAGVMFHCVLPAARGSSVLYSGESFLEWAPHLGRTLKELEADFLTLNPFILEMILRVGLDAGWRGSVISLTAPLKRTHRAAFLLLAGHHPREIYGMTEAAGPVLFDGKSLGCETRLGPDSELELKGAQLHLGYGTNGNFEPAPEWFRTGDQFEQDAGLYVFETRLRELIDTGGRKVAPRLIEETIEALPELAECVAFPVVLGGVERAGIVYVRKPECGLSPAVLASAVERFLGEKFSPDLKPRFWREVDSIPRLKNGKANRMQVRSQWGHPERAPGG